MMSKTEFHIFPISGERKVNILPCVSAIGWTTTGEPRKIKRIYDWLEFCFRLSSEDTRTVDFVNGTAYYNSFPHLYVKIPGTVHVNDIRHGRAAFFLHYKTSELERFTAAGFNFVNPFRNFSITPEFLEIITRLKACCEKLDSAGTAENIDVLAIQLLECVWLKYKTEDETDPENRIRQIASYQLANLAAPMDFNLLAERNGFSRRSFYRHWKNIYSVPPNTFLAERRMDLALSLLMEFHWSIARIAERMHYPSCTYFIQCFKRRFGITPAAFRRKNETSTRNILDTEDEPWDDRRV